MAAETHGIGLPPRLHPGEVECVGGAAERRRRDFALGRDCARRALGKLGIAAAAIPRNADGSPRWPPAIVGSITHTEGYAAALAAHRIHYRSIGIDAERTGRISEAMEPLVFDLAELAWLKTLNERARGVFATVLFSAKEAYYKAWSPAMATPLGFHDIHIRVDRGTFCAFQPNRSVEDVWASGVRGCFIVHGDLVLTSACLPAEA